jgi:hypothetical protein
LPNGTASVAYASQRLTGTDGTPPYNWSVIGGSLPPGLTLGSGGVISGTSTASGVFNFMVQLIDGLGATATREVSINVASALVIGTTWLPNGPSDALYSATLVAHGGTPPYLWSIQNGSLPPGLTLSSAGVISGSPSVVTDASFVVRATDSVGVATARAFSLRILPPALVFGVDSLPNGKLGAPYSYVFTAAGGAPPYTWSLDGAASPGIGLAANGPFIGTPTQHGTFRFPVTVRDTGGQSVTRTVTLVVEGAPPLAGVAPLAITTATASNGTVGAPYSQSFSAAGGSPPYRWAASGLPGGLSMSAAGELTGTPQAAGRVSFTVVLADSVNNSISKSFRIEVFQGLTITSASVPSGIGGVAYSTSLAATGGRPPYRWSGTAPAGLSIDTSGRVSGTPTSAGDFTLSATVTDSLGTQATKDFSLRIAPPLAILTTSPLASATVGVRYTTALMATGGRPPYGWSGSPPAGLSLTAAGEIAGTPSTAGTFRFAAEVTDATNTKVSRAFTIEVVEGLVIQPTSLPKGTAGLAYSGNLSVGGGRPPYTWSSTESLPPGLSLSGDGSIRGTPTAAGTWRFTAAVRDALNRSVSRSFAITIDLPPPPRLNVIGLPSTGQPGQQLTPNLRLGRPYPVDITAIVTLTFTSDVGGEDGTIQFATGGRRAERTIPAGSTDAFGDLAFQTGTVAGVITLRVTLWAGQVDVTPTPPSAFTVRIPRQAPVITSARIQPTPTGPNFIAIGFTTTRDCTTATFTVEPLPGSSQQTKTLTEDVTRTFAAWFQSDQSNATGGQFTYTQPFSIEGYQGAVRSITLSLTNSAGQSAPVTVQVQ